MEDWRATIAETASRATSYYKAVLNPKAISIFSPFATREPLSTINFLQAVLDFIRRYEPAAAKEGLYSHQATLLKNYSAGAGPDFILTSAIGSGKILCFWAWVIDQLIKHRTATAVLATNSKFAPRGIFSLATTKFSPRGSVLFQACSLLDFVCKGPPFLVIDWILDCSRSCLYRKAVISVREKL